MINPFKLIKSNNRFILDNHTIVVENISHYKVKWYDLNEWNKRQPFVPKYNYTNLFKFIFKSKNRN